MKLRMIWNIIRGKPVMYKMHIYGYAEANEPAVLVDNHFGNYYKFHKKVLKND